MSYYRRGYTRQAPLTPPAELVGRNVKWRPKSTDGGRGAITFGVVQSFDSDGRTLVIRVYQAVSMWQPNPHRDVVIPLSHGPFTAV